ncbi:hypothetical protein FKM82_016652 [Ascaphus truei]
MQKVYQKLFILLLLSCICLGFFFHYQSIQYPVYNNGSVTQNHRKDILKSVCLQNNLTNSSSLYRIDPFVARQLFVVHSHKFIYCEVPKVGCSNWKRIILLLNMTPGVITANDLQHEDIHTTPLLTKLNAYSPEEQKQLLNNYTKVMFTRDPLQRLVSAYRDKFLHAEPYYSTTFADMIKAKVGKKLNSTGNVTFEEFVRYIIQENPRYRDTHWKPMFHLCDPCNIQYDIVGKFETMKQDADYVLKTVGAPKNLTFPSIKHYSNESRTNGNISSEYFRNLPTKLLGHLMDIYRLDFSMFAYSTVDFETENTF